MKTDTSDMVSIHPYFKAKSGKFPEVKAALSAFIAKTATEQDNIFYDFTTNGDELFCREAYRGAKGALAHLENVAAPLGELLKVADLIRLEIHGPAMELEKLKSPLAHLKPSWFTRQCGV